ncbi:hypothetical protein AB833_13320 [Chromatiales bacterium (ex Bugula neritina AB1)]|nr:hypothetical protein AB833_13320 [Chromatiales bacterium (ex Bugula neritina AB1)]
MRYKLAAACVLLPLLVACGGGGGNSGDNTTGGNATPDPDDNDQAPVATVEERIRPASGTFQSAATPLRDNGANLFQNEGPQTVNAGRVASWPGLRYGDFLLTNNPWNASAATYEGWYQTVSLIEGANNTATVIDWDWGASADIPEGASAFDTKSYPELIYGTKSQAERSGDYATTGLPVEIYDAPEITIDYAYNFQGRRSSSATAGGTDSEFNVAIESFYHQSCDIQRTGQGTDNQVMEIMVWLHTGDNLPSGQAPVAVKTTADGKTFDVYVKTAGADPNPNYTAYVLRNETLSGTILYSELLRDAQDNAGVYGTYQLKDTDCLANILIGTEIWHGAGTFTLTDYQITRTY